MVDDEILLIDNYDSFAHNLGRYLVRLGQRVRVVRNDAVDLRALGDNAPAAIVLSPGPGHPVAAGCSVSLVQAFSGRIPILGICLGHQAIVAAYGGRIARAPSPMHGRASKVHHRRQGIFKNVTSPFQAGRYHSLVVDQEDIPSELEMIAWTDDNVVMAVQHRNEPTIGLQFHPESILTECGYSILENFLRMGGFTMQPNAPDFRHELFRIPQPDVSPPKTPVTF